MNSAIGERHILPWQIKSIFFMRITSLVKKFARGVKSPPVTVMPLRKYNGHRR